MLECLIDDDEAISQVNIVVCIWGKRIKAITARTCSHRLLRLDNSDAWCRSGILFEKFDAINKLF